MNFGYLIFVSSSETTDYLKCAYALAMSIKLTQKPGYDKIALVIDEKSKLESINSSWVFDEVIEWDKETFWNGRSWMDQLTPWEHTVCLDADMLFFRDHSHVIDYFIDNQIELYIPNKVYTYRNEIIKDNFYRKTFIRNNLPNLYSMFVWFKKNTYLDFFELQRNIIKNPNEFSNLFLNNHKPNIMGTDEAFSLSAKILGVENSMYELDFPKIVHLKGQIQNWPWPAEKCSDHVGLYLDKEGTFKIGNFQQTDIVHYVEKDFITDEVLNILEELIWIEKN